MMRTFLMALLIVLTAGCNNGGKIKAGLDTTVNDIKASAVVDSVKAEGERVLDSVKAKSKAVADSSKVKGARLLNGVGEGLKKLSKKLDSTK